MSTDYRKSNVKIEQVHGTLPSKSSREACIRNYIYGVRSLVINLTSDIKLNIRIIGYEVPIYDRSKSRDECIDLVGYDEFYCPWVIELKTGKSSELLDDVVSQVNRYAKAFDEGIRVPVQDEVRWRLLWPSFSFEGEINKMILSDRSFFTNRKECSENAQDIVFCSYYRIADENALMKTPRPMVKLKIEKNLTSHSRQTALVNRSR